MLGGAFGRMDARSGRRGRPGRHPHRRDYFEAECEHGGAAAWTGELFEYGHIAPRKTLFATTFRGELTGSRSSRLKQVARSVVLRTVSLWKSPKRLSKALTCIYRSHRRKAGTSAKPGRDPTDYAEVRKATAQWEACAADVICTFHVIAASGKSTPLFAADSTRNLWLKLSGSSEDIGDDDASGDPTCNNEIDPAPASDGPEEETQETCPPGEETVDGCRDTEAEEAAALERDDERRERAGYFDGECFYDEETGTEYCNRDSEMSEEELEAELTHRHEAEEEGDTCVDLDEAGEDDEIDGSEQMPMGSALGPDELSQIPVDEVGPEDGDVAEEDGDD